MHTLINSPHFCASKSWPKAGGKLTFIFALFWQAIVPALHGQYWQEDTGFNAVLESSTAFVTTQQVMVGADGKVITSAPYAINGIRTNSLARLNADGSLDTSFAPPADAVFIALAIYSDGRILALRTVTNEFAQSTTAIVRLTANGALDPTFAAAALNSSIVPAYTKAHLLPSGQILASGDFRTVAGADRRGIAVLNSDGSVAAGFTSPFEGNSSSQPFAASPLSDGRILVTGPFSNLGSAKLTYVARLQSDGRIDATFNANSLALPLVPSQAYPLSDGRLIVFADKLYLANADGTRDSTFAPQLVGSSPVFGPPQANGEIFYFTTNNGRREVHRLKFDGTTDPTFAVRDANPEPFTVAFPVRAASGSYYIGSAVTSTRYSTRFHVTRLFSDGSVDGTFNPRFSAKARVDAFVRQPDGKIMLAGNLEWVNGTPSAGYALVRMNSDGSRDASFVASDVPINAAQLLLQPDGKVVVVRNLQYGSPLPAAVRFGADGARDQSFVFADTQVASALVMDSAGRFYANRTESNGTMRLARYMADGALDPTFQTSTTGRTDLIAPLPDGTVVVTSKFTYPFTTFQGTTLTRLKHDGSADPTFTIDYNLLPQTLSGLVGLPDGKVLVIGSGLTATGSALRFVRFDQQGAADYTYFAPSASLEPLRISSAARLQIGGVLYDLLRAANPPAGSQLRAHASVGLVAFVSFDVTAEGRLLSLANTEITSELSFQIRTATAGPSVDAKPHILYGPSRSSPYHLYQGDRLTLSATVGGLFPITCQWLRDGTAITGATSATLSVTSTTPADAGAYVLQVTNPYGTTTTSPVQVTIDLTTTTPTLAASPMSQSAASGSSISLSAQARGNPIPTFTWFQNGTSLPSSLPYSTSATDDLRVATIYLQNVSPAQAGIYTAVASSSMGELNTSPAIVGISSTAKVIGTGSEVGANILHPNGNVFDQVLLEGAAASITAEASLNQITRLSFIDLNHDIVQIEFSGAGTLSLVLANAGEPALPVNYSQNVNYVRGHAAIVITGANETTNVSVFSVGRATAFDPTGSYNILQAPSVTNDPARNGSSLFVGHITTDYDGLADIAFIAISSANGKFGGVRTANTSYFATRGFTGLYAPGVEFSGPVFVGDIDAFDAATPVLIYKAAAETRITGGDLAQTNGAAVRIGRDISLNFTGGSTSHGDSLPVQPNRGTFERRESL